MSAPIRVRLGHSPVLRKIHNAWVNQGWRRKFYWHCTACTPSQFESNGGTADTLAAAADAGRAHLAEHHAAQMPAVAHGDPEPAYAVHRCSGECPPAPSDPLDRAHNEGSRR